MTSESSQYSTKKIECFKCYGFAYFAYQCPTRSPLMDEIQGERLDEYGLEEKVYEAQGDFSNVLGDLGMIGRQLNVVRYLYTASRDKD